MGSDRYFEERAAAEERGHRWPAFLSYVRSMLGRPHEEFSSLAEAIEAKDDALAFTILCDWFDTIPKPTRAGSPWKDGR